MITQKRLKQLVHYDPKTGIFRAKIRRSNCKDILGCKAVRGKITYLRIVVDWKYYYAHRLAWLYIYGKWPRLLDHINSNGCDNRIANLRKASHSDNHANTRWRRDNKSGFKGVQTTKNGKKFCARIVTGGKNFYLGTFQTPEDAHAAYIVAARKLFGEFANVGSRSG